jgi:hypothetical protein
MTAEQLFMPTIEFSEGERVAANTDILERVARILFVIFMDDDNPMSEDEVDELAEDVFGMASVLMAVAGMNIVGRNSEGDYVARFKPYKSLEHFSKEKGIK